MAWAPYTVLLPFNPYGHTDFWGCVGGTSVQSTSGLPQPGLCLLGFSSWLLSFSLVCGETQRGRLFSGPSADATMGLAGQRETELDSEYSTLEWQVPPEL